MNSTADSTLNTVSMVCYCIEFILGVIGNGLVILCVMCQKSQRNPTFIIIGSLALADMLFIVGRVSEQVLRVDKMDAYSATTSCKASMFVLQLSSYASSYHLVFVAVVRYICLAHPFKAQQHITNSWALKASFILWLGLFIVLSPLLFTIGTVQRKIGGKTKFICNANPASMTASRDIQICCSIFSYFIPLTMLIIFHSIKAKVVSQMTKTVKSSEKKQMSSMVVLVILLFGILLFPSHCKNMFHIAGYKYGMKYMNVAFRVLADLNNCINPLVYAMLSSSFRKNLKQLFCSWRKNGRVSQMPEPTTTQITLYYNYTSDRTQQSLTSMV